MAQGLAPDGDADMLTASHKYGCHDRKPFVKEYPSNIGAVHHWIPTFGKPDCQYTLTTLGQQDKSCTGCKHRLQKGNE